MPQPSFPFLLVTVCLGCLAVTPATAKPRTYAVLELESESEMDPGALSNLQYFIRNQIKPEMRAHGWKPLAPAKMERARAPHLKELYACTESCEVRQAQILGVELVIKPTHTAQDGLHTVTYESFYTPDGVLRGVSQMSTVSESMEKLMWSPEDAQYRLTENQELLEKFEAEHTLAAGEQIYCQQLSQMGSYSEDYDLCRATVCSVVPGLAWTSMTPSVTPKKVSETLAILFAGPLALLGSVDHLELDMQVGPDGVPEDVSCSLKVAEHQELVEERVRQWHASGLEQRDGTTPVQVHLTCGLGVVLDPP